MTGVQGPVGHAQAAVTQCKVCCCPCYTGTMPTERPGGGSSPQAGSTLPSQQRQRRAGVDVQKHRPLRQPGSRGTARLGEGMQLLLVLLLMLLLGGGVPAGVGGRRRVLAEVKPWNGREEEERRGLAGRAGCRGE